VANLRELQQAEIEQRLSAFRNELKELLDRHGAILGVTVEGDTHGIDDAFVDVSLAPIENGKNTLISEAFRLDPVDDPS